MTTDNPYSELRKRYYNSVFVLFEMLKAMKDREVVFIDKEQGAVRGMSIKSLLYLKERYFEFCHFEKKNYSIYISCAKYKNIPNFTFDMTMRTNETGKWFQDQAKEEIYGYDLLLDFDYNERLGTRKEFIKEVTDFFLLLQGEKIKFYAIPSGKNYQFCVPSEIWGYTGCYIEDNGINEYKINTIIGARDLIENIKKRFRLRHLDISGAGSLSKIMKCPYSAVNNIVCLPMANCFFEDMNLFEINFVLSHVYIKNRGLCLQNSKATNKEFYNFAKKYELL